MTKLKEQFEPVDLTVMSDDEIYHIGECLAKDLKKLIDDYKPYFIKQLFFRLICKAYHIIINGLKREERVVE